MTIKVDIDARGLGCPLPVVKTKQALGAIEKGTITVLIERPEGCQNIERFAKSQGHTVDIIEQDNLFYLHVNKEKSGETNIPAGSGDVFVITSDKFGTGDDELGAVLMRAFITTLCDSDKKPAKILFINRGIMLTTEGSPVLDDLQSLAKEGIEIYSCGTCLDYYQRQEKLKVGLVTNMYDTVNSLLSAGKVIRI